MNSKLNVDLLFENDIDLSIESPEDEWSSLNVELGQSIKSFNYKEGLYDPGSGEICTKYIPLSTSSILRHAYYNYPAVTDPGILEALSDPEPKAIYPDDGQKLYLKLCQESGLCPISSFHRQLLHTKINLRYYGVQQKAFRVVAMSLKLNKTVTVLDLTDNWIDEDGCYHLGEMLGENATLKTLILHGCRIGPEGAKRLCVNLPLNRALRELNLCKNNLSNTGVEYLAKSISLGADVCTLDLSYNGLTLEAVNSLIDALEINNKLVSLNLSWNMIQSTKAIFDLCSKLAETDRFLDLDLSWNALRGARMGTSFAILLKNKNITNLNLSNNQLFGPAVRPIAKAIEDAPNLISLNLSSNPLTPQDAYKLLCPMIKPTVKLKTLLLENVPVNSNFVELCDKIMSSKPETCFEITYGSVNAGKAHKTIDLQDLLLNRIDYIAKKKFKKRKVDIALIILELYKEHPQPMDTKVFLREVKERGLPLDDELADQLVTFFAGPVKAKSSTVSLEAIVEYIKRKWPERQLPSTPPPTQPPPLLSPLHPKKISKMKIKEKKIRV